MELKKLYFECIFLFIYNITNNKTHRSLGLSKLFKNSFKQGVSK